MEKRTVAIIATGATALLCGCPGLLSVFGGGMMAAISFAPGATINNFDGSSDPTTALITGLGTCCFGLIFVAIPIAVGFLTLRKKADAPITPMGDSQPPVSM